MAKDIKEGKIAVANALTQFESLHKSRPNSFLVRVFFDAKADEITDLFIDGPPMEITNLVSSLNRVAPMYSRKWRNIKF